MSGPVIISRTFKPSQLCVLQRIQHRPISPDVFDIDGKSLHYKMPVGAISSITNRVTGVGMSVGEFILPNLTRCPFCLDRGNTRFRKCFLVGMVGAGFIALTGDLPGTIEYMKSFGGLVTVPCKALIAFPLIYHYVAGAWPV
jgi:succinate dehydrogenase (ubiquinone) cytochrome b560 subunit